MLALIGFLVAPLAGPFDPIATSQHPHLGDSFYRPLLSAATHQLTMANVQPQIQLIFAGAVSRTLNHPYAWDVVAVTFNVLGPLIDGLDDPAAIQAAVAALEDSKLTHQWMSPRAEFHIIALKAKLRSGTSDDVGQPHEFANQNEVKHEHLKGEHVVEQSAKRIDEHAGAKDRDGGWQSGKDRGSLDDSGMRAERGEEGVEIAGV